jgi:PDZ domain-containing protein
MKSKTKIILGLISICLLIPIVCILLILKALFSAPNYTSEMQRESELKDFKASRDVIKLPLGKYLIIKPKGGTKKLFLFKIVKFQDKGLAYEGVLLTEIENNKFKILEIKKGNIVFQRLFSKGKYLFRELYITILPVNSLAKHSYYLYGTYKGDNIYIDESKVINLPEGIVWHKKIGKNSTKRIFGFSLIKSKDGFQILQVLKDSSANKAEIQAGCILLKIDDQPISDWNIKQVVEFLNKKNTRVLTIKLKDGKIKQVPLVKSDYTIQDSMKEMKIINLNPVPPARGEE